MYMLVSIFYFFFFIFWLLFFFFFFFFSSRRRHTRFDCDWSSDVCYSDLYNLRSDIGERNDLAKERPEIARRLRPLILEWEKDVDSEAKTSSNFIAPGPPGPGGRGAPPASAAPK